MRGFRVTYETVTPESAEIGEAEETGFVTPGEWKTPIEEALKEKDESFDMELREALGLCSPIENCGAWFAESGGRENYSDGSHETRSLHPPRNITAASYGRLRRLLGIRR
jgi:hypothetical protein